MDAVAQIAGLVAAISALSGFIAFLVKKYQDDMKTNYEARIADLNRRIEDLKAQVERWATVADKDADTAREALSIAKELKDTTARIERELIQKGGRRVGDS